MAQSIGSSKAQGEAVEALPGRPGAGVGAVLSCAKKKGCKKQKCSKWKGGKCRCGRD